MVAEMNGFAVKWLATAGSTNTWLRENATADEAVAFPGHIFIVAARAQTAGRGQRGNSWESEPGANLTVSALVVPSQVKAVEQFYVSEAVAMAVADTVDAMLEEAGSPLRASVKWPNDIYVGDRKISGILIENSLSGAAIERSICGIGLNVNQRRFVSDAPNPVSVVQLTGREAPLDHALTLLGSALVRETAPLTIADPDFRAEALESLHSRYMGRLWRRDGYHRWLDNLRGEVLEARICGVAPSGHLSLSTRDGRLSTYAFKEVAALL